MTTYRYALPTALMPPEIPRYATVESEPTGKLRFILSFDGHPHRWRFVTKRDATNQMTTYAIVLGLTLATRQS